MFMFHVLIDCPIIQRIWQRAHFDYNSRQYHGSLAKWIFVEGGRNHFHLAAFVEPGENVSDIALLEAKAITG
ncbi:uncharacterized protein G2W53_011871 [Senna tora]|uniref:Uncharacterized protein n=1 Tax=Senna tora TaxID=362788 RepID=A0A834TW72_9FABA|nr:uncharacterized protein G2W53_011871 [Senna tora]